MKRTNLSLFPTFRLTASFATILIVGLNSMRVVAQSAEKSMSEHAHPATSPSTTLTVTVDRKTTALSLADIQAMPQKTIVVRNEHTKLDESYLGVLLGDLLANRGFAAEKTTHTKMLHSYVMAEGTDKYWVLYSATEIEASEHNGSVIVAIAKDGKPLGEDGLFKLVASEDKKPQRWVRNLTALRLKSAE